MRVASTPIPLAEPPCEIARGTSAWPTCLDALPDPPDRLRVAGQLPALECAVAVVGTRHADADSLVFTRRLASDLCALGATVISGGARGIDRAAHEGALDAGGRTIAVLATGFDGAYPPAHAPLFAEIAQQGALVTEAPDGSLPFKAAFLRRNRLIAALSQIVVVVQAPRRSGALSTAAWASRLEKRLFAVPGAPWDPRADGCLWLLRRGARVCTSASDVLSVRPTRAAGLETAAGQGSRNSPDIAMLDQNGQAVLRALGNRRRHPDEIAAALGVGPAKVRGTLLALELAGLVVGSDGAYLRARVSD